MMEYFGLEFFDVLWFASLLTYTNSLVEIIFVYSNYKLIVNKVDVFVYNEQVEAKREKVKREHWS